MDTGLIPHCWDSLKPVCSHEAESREIFVLLALPQALPVFTPIAEVLEVLRAGDQGKKGKRKGRNKQETLAFAESSAHREEVKTPLDLAKVSVGDLPGGLEVTGKPGGQTLVKV